jgi:hypothetical protein
MRRGPEFSNGFKGYRGETPVDGRDYLPESMREELETRRRIADVLEGLRLEREVLADVWE